MLIKPVTIGSWGQWGSPDLLLLFSHSVECNSLQFHGLQHARLPCLSLSPGICSDSCPLSQWCYLTISSYAALLSFCFQSFLASESFPVSQLFTAGGQSIRASASANPSNEYSGLISFRIDWFDLLAVQGTLKSLLQHHNSKPSVPWFSAFFMTQFSRSYLKLEKL